MTRTGRRLALGVVAMTLVLVRSDAPSGRAGAEAPREQSAPEKVKVRATGQAPAELPRAREAAIEQALRRAVEAGAGVTIESVSRSEDFVLVLDVILARSAGYVKSYEVLEENPDQEGLYTVRVSAMVQRGEFTNDLESLRTIMRRKGRPVVMVAGRTGSAVAEADSEAELQKILTDRGAKVFDLSSLDEVKRREARVADRDDRDVRKAAAIADEVRANVLALVTVEAGPARRQEQYGVESHVADATVTIRLVDPKTATVFAVEPVDAEGRSGSADGAVRAAVIAGTRSAADRALLRIGQHWLEELDGRQGAEISLALHSMTFKQVDALVQRLRKVEGVKDVIVDSTDAKGVSRVRVIANTTTADLSSILSRLDSTLVIRAMTTTSIELGY